MFDGFVRLDGTFETILVTTDQGVSVPTDGNVAPTYRVYGPSGELQGSGSLVPLDQENVTGLWFLSFDVRAQDGYVAGDNYHVVMEAMIDNLVRSGGDYCRTFVVT